jgi:hypothetical protein
VYKLDGAYTDADIQVPLRNIKKRKGTRDNVGVDTHHGLSIYVHAFNAGQEPLHYKFGLFKKKIRSAGTGGKEKQGKQEKQEKQEKQGK